MTQKQKDKLAWLLSDLCASSVKLGKVRKEYSPLWYFHSKEQDKFFNRAMLYVDEIIN